MSHHEAPALPRYLTPADLQWVMGVSESTVTEWNRRKAIPFFREGRLIRYQAQDVLNFIAGKTVRGRTLQASPLAVSDLRGDAWERVERLVDLTVRNHFQYLGLAAAVVKDSGAGSSAGALIVSEAAGPNSFRS